MGSLFAGAATLAILGFLVRTLLRAFGRGRLHLDVILLELGVTVVAAALVWHFGWRPLLAMRRDLAAGAKRVMTGKIAKLERIDNAYGEVITWATVDGVRLLTKADLFAGRAVGDLVTVELLPTSRVALAVHAAG